MVSNFLVMADFQLDFQISKPKSNYPAFFIKIQSKSTYDGYLFTKILKTKLFPVKMGIMIRNL